MRDRCVLTATGTSHLSHIDLERYRISGTDGLVCGHQTCGCDLETSRKRQTPPVSRWDGCQAIQWAYLATNVFENRQVVYMGEAPTI